MLRHLILLATSVALLGLTGACAPYHDVNRINLETAPQHYTQFDLRLGWETRPVNGTTVINGEARNVRYAYMYDLEIWAAVLDSGGKAIARSVSFIIPRQLEMDDTAPFTLKLPVAAPSGTTIRFTYRYRGSDGGDSRRLGDGGTSWTQTFDAVVP
jgi:hypothetical protein